MDKTVRLYKSGNANGALSVVTTDVGNSLMAELRLDLHRMASEGYAELARDSARLLTRSRLLAWFSGLSLTLVAVSLMICFGRLRAAFLRNEELSEGLRESREAYRELASHVESIRETDRTQIARDLHDELGQSLTGIKMDIGSAHSGLQRSDLNELAKRLASVTENADEAIRSVRRIATDLRPPQLDHLGLVGAIDGYVEQFRTRSRLNVQVRLPQDELPLSRAQNVALFRIAQESLTNVARHAGATTVRIEGALLADQFVLSISDDGRGIATDGGRKRSLGLLGMSERARSVGGELAIASEPGNGTTVKVKVGIQVEMEEAV